MFVSIRVYILTFECCVFIHVNAQLMWKTHSVFSLLSHETDVSRYSKKRELLRRLGPAESVEDFFIVLRICHFSTDDLLMCADVPSVDLKRHVLQYENPCNARLAAKRLRLLTSESYGSELFSPVVNRLGDHTTCREFPELTLSTVSIITGETGFGLVTNQPFQFGDRVLTLNQNIPISILTALRDPEFGGSSMVNAGVHPDVVFMLYLLHLRAKGGSDVWGQFFASQPESFDTLFEVPVEVLDALEAPELKTTVLNQNASLKDLYDSLSQDHTWEEFLWAKSLCTSRAFSLAMPVESDFEKHMIEDFYPDGKLTVILPIVHFLNHDFRAQCDTPEVQKDGSVCVFALTDIQPGEEIFVVYGGMNNKEFMLNYGFFVPGNPYDQMVQPDGKLVRRKNAKKTITHAKIPNLGKYTKLVEDYLADKPF